MSRDTDRALILLLYTILADFTVISRRLATALYHCRIISRMHSASKTYYWWQVCSRMLSLVAVT